MSKSNMLYKIYYIVNNRGVLIFDGAYFRFLHEFAQNKGGAYFRGVLNFDKIRYILRILCIDFLRMITKPLTVT